ncbi:MAG: hypothetical protein IPJ81_10455 [Chitinophagaceae bacterium]|jgi:hypothetical protein|nr:hypothetical protein [Chitinophagaceae bacterium]
MLRNDSIMWFKYIDLTQPDFAKTTLQFSELPQWNCGVSWNKEGFFADSIKTPTHLSEIFEYFDEKISVKKLNAIKSFQKKSRVVIFTCGKNGLVFQMAYINHKCYFTVVEPAYQICA